MKISIPRLVFLVALLQLSIANHFGQSTAVKLERYELLESGLAASFPKLPLIVERSDICRHQARRTYYAYNDGALYHISVVRELKGDDSFCSDTKKFNAKALEGRKKELAKTATLSDTSINGKSLTRFIGKSTTTLLLDDLQNNRWLEISVSSHDPLKRDSIEFVSSAQTASKGGGAYIGQGAKSMIGDPLPKDLPSPSAEEIKTSKKESDGVIVIGKPHPPFTDKAREKNEQGTVVLKVEFRADGTIGDIATLKSLRYGLTEQAIAAAKRFAFVPARFNGVPVTIFRTVEFGFHIY